MSGEAAEMVARRFHEAYERLAPSFGYETRKASAKPWDEVPENNRKLMIAVCAEVEACVIGLIEAARLMRSNLSDSQTVYEKTMAALRAIEQAAGGAK